MKIDEGIQLKPGWTRKVLQMASVVTVTCSLFAALATGAGAAGSSGPMPLVRPEAFRPAAAPAGARYLGSVGDSEKVQLNFTLAPRDPASVQALINALYTPGSSEYHHWLAKGQFLQEFGPSRSSVESVESWLKSRGLSDTNDAGFAIDVTATVAQVQKALGVSLQSYRTEGAVGFRADQAPLVPASLAEGTVTAVVGLDTLSRFQNYLDPLPPSQADRGKAPENSSAKPNADGLTPCSDATAAAQEYDSYTLDTLGSDYEVGSLLSDNQNGTGKTVAVYELAPHSATDVAAYQSCFGLTNSVTTKLVDGGGTVNSNGTAEADIDIEQIETQSPHASILSYEGPNTEEGAYQVWNSIVSADAAQVVSSSWGECEPDAEAGGPESFFSTLLGEAASQGQTVLVASGDSGSEACFQSDQSDTSLEVGYPASDPHVTAVGGTTLDSSGEKAWNYCDDSGTVDCAQNYGIGSGTGGLSRYEGKPAWQPTYFEWASSQPCGTVCRQVPDISANAGTGMVVYVNGAWNAYIGTSLAAPFIAGIVADTDTGCDASAGLYAPTLYRLAAQSVYGTALNDITTGNNDFTDTNGGEFAAGSGYDLATGLGTPRAEGLSCAEVNSVEPSAALPGAHVIVHGLGLEKAKISFGSTTAQVLSASVSQATVVVPRGTGSVSISADSDMGRGKAFAHFDIESPPPPPPSPPSGYDLVGRDGGVFVFPLGQSGGYYGSLPGLGVRVDDIRGMVASSDEKGYYLVGSDGGVFAFGDAKFANSLPGLHIRVDDIVGIVPTTNNKGYFLVGADGGVFAFGGAPFLGSLPGEGIHIDDVIGIAATPSDQGYWVVAANGTVYSFGDAPRLGSATGTASPVSGITTTPSGKGYWIVTQKGAVYPFGDAKSYGSLPGLGVTPSRPIIGLVPTSNGEGYWLVGSDGGIFAFGDAPFVGSLPALGVSVTDIVGAVPTHR